MNSSPITSWDGAEAIFTFAASPTGIALFLALAVVITLGVIVNMITHEKKSFSQWYE